jgi:uncharacterized protein (TIGR02246 family)
MFARMAAESPQALADAFGAAMSAGDVEGALELWVEDATIVGADGEPVSGREEIARALGAIVSHEVKVDIRLAKTFTAGDTALVLGTLTMSGTGQDGQPFSQVSQSTVIYCRDSNGHWRIAIDAPWGLPSE